MGGGRVAAARYNKKRIEDSIKAFMSKYYSRGPSLAKVYVTENCITIYCKDILTSLEKKLFLQDEKSMMLIKNYREKAIFNNEAEFLKIATTNINAAISNYYIDFNIKGNT